MDVSTAIASAVISAGVSAVVSLLVVSRTTVLKRRAERRDDARQALREAVSPLLEEVLRYEFMNPPEPRRDPTTSQIEDHSHVTRIRAASEELPGWRRRLVDRRCRRVFGVYWTQLAIDLPGSTGQTFSERSVSSWFAENLRSDRESPKAGQGPVDGLMHRAYCQRAGHPLVQQLKFELRRLAAGR